MSNNNSSTRNFIPMSNKYDRVVLLVDMDCFYCQVEAQLDIGFLWVPAVTTWNRPIIWVTNNALAEKLDPSLKDKPLAVVQYNAWRGGGIIAVNYAARAKGVTRHMRGDEAKEQCSDIQLVKVPNLREKADLTKYREAGKDVANVLQRFTPLLERASVDEAYLDITEAVNKRLQEMNDGKFILQPQELVNTYACGFPTIGEFLATITTSFTDPSAGDENLYRHFNENDIAAVRQSNIRLLIGASIASEIRAAVKADTTYECSAGIAHNKILAKLACGINKPNKQTLLPLAEIPGLFETLPISKIKGLGAKFGEEICERMGVRYLGQLLKFTEAELQKKFDEKNGSWLYNISRGIDLEAVTPRFYSKSIGCCKKFPGRNNITGLKTLQHWLNELANEINERLEKDICENNRRAKQMVVNFIQEFDGEEISSSRSAQLQCYDTEILAKTSLDIIKVNTKQFFRAGSESVLNNPIKFLGISVGKFETISNSQNNIQEMFAQQAAKKKRFSADDKQEQRITTTVNSTITSTSSTVNVATNSLSNVSKENHNDKDLNPMPKNKKKQDVRSFFLNALNKQSQMEEGKQNDTISNKNTVNTSTILSVKTSQSPTNSLTENNEENSLITTPHNSDCKVKMSKMPEKSFFAKVLKKKPDNLDEKTNSSEAVDITAHANTAQDFDTNNSDSNELNDLINDINTMQKAEQEIKNHLNLMVKTPPLQFESNSNVTEATLVTNDISAPSASYTLPNKRKHDKISDSDEQNLKDYQSRYAEFAVPEFRSEFLQFTNCSTCGAKILNDSLSIQTHQDHHFAQELSKQQRHEYRDEIRTKMNSVKSPPNNNTISNKRANKTQPINNTIKKSLNADITKFLTTSSPSLPSSPSNQIQQAECDLTNMEVCDVCKEPVKFDDILEHKDFHMAKELQRKLNQLEVHTVEIIKKPITASTRKNMNSSLRSSNSQAKVTAKPITQFFTQSNI